MTKDWLTKWEETLALEAQYAAAAAFDDAQAEAAKDAADEAAAEAAEEQSLDYFNRYVAGDR